MPASPFVGAITIFGGNFAIRNWAFCQGQQVSISSNQALFALIGTYYGGDGRQYFNLPDLRGRTVIGEDRQNNYTLGRTGGEADVTLTDATIPAHTHGGLSVPISETDFPTPDDVNRGFVQNSGSIEYFGTTEGSGKQAGLHLASPGGQSHDNRQPYMAVNYLIALNGVFPSRN